MQHTYPHAKAWLQCLLDQGGLQSKVTVAASLQVSSSLETPSNADAGGGAPAVVYRLLCIVCLEHAPVRRECGGGQVILRTTAVVQMSTTQQRSNEGTSLPANRASNQPAAHDKPHTAVKKLMLSLRLLQALLDYLGAKADNKVQTRAA